MCGIVGHISLNETISERAITQAVLSLKHRGPDAHSTEIINTKVGFGHTRLAFLDLSEKGKQPMFNADESICITFNGEIYNYLELKAELKDFYSFSTSTDTEVLLAAYEKWGISFLEKIDGMFAFGLYDKRVNKTFLVRDRFGIKPLYYYKAEDNILFASELKALSYFPVFKKELNKSAFCDFFVYRYIPAPKTIWENSFKVEAAHYVEIDNSTMAIHSYEYWQALGITSLSKGTALINFVGETIKKSVKDHARADVPIGTLLSGGYDSSAIALYLSKINPNTLSFSIGFKDWDKSEDYYAEIVANYLGLTNKKVIANEKSLEVIDLMSNVYDEPIADISIIPTFLVNQLARKDVKAVMSGEGADELFGGYHWHKKFYELSYPSGLLNKVKTKLNPINTVDFYAEAMSMGMFDEVELKEMLQPAFHSAIEDDVYWFYKKHFKKELSPLKSIQYLDMKCFMGELVLTKVDRASMANSLEVRFPFLDHRLFEKIFSSSEKEYFRLNQTKYLLYKNLVGQLPEEILNREKQGFVGPDCYYMNKAWYAEQLQNSNLVKANIIKQVYIDNLLAQEYDWRIWKILVMEKWYTTWMA